MLITGFARSTCVVGEGLAVGVSAGFDDATGVGVAVGGEVAIGEVGAFDSGGAEA